MIATCSGQRVEAYIKESPPNSDEEDSSEDGEECLGAGSDDCSISHPSNYQRRIDNSIKVWSL